MGLLKIEGVTHWSIPVNNLEESEEFYGDLLGLNPRGSSRSGPPNTPFFYYES
jgi:catechol 2,3-dioxygenase-like lactoylglutathione lyase family enzyme